MNIFISYAGSDRAAAEFISAQLRAAGHDIWIDVEGIAGGANWWRSIEEAIKTVDIVMILLSTSSSNSKWVTHETNLGIAAGKPLFPILLEKTEIPIPLVNRMYLDATSGLETAIPHILRDLEDREASIPRISEEEESPFAPVYRGMLKYGFHHETIEQFEAMMTGRIGRREDVISAYFEENLSYKLIMGFEDEINLLLWKIILDDHGPAIIRGYRHKILNWYGIDIQDIPIMAELPLLLRIRRYKYTSSTLIPFAPFSDLFQYVDPSLLGLISDLAVNAIYDFLKYKVQTAAKLIAAQKPRSGTKQYRLITEPIAAPLPRPTHVTEKIIQDKKAIILVGREFGWVSESREIVRKWEDDD